MGQKQKIEAVIFKNEDGTYEMVTEISLTEKEETAIMDILADHETEGSSVLGSKIDIMEEWLGF